MKPVISFMLMASLSACDVKIENTPTATILGEATEGHTETDAAACLKLEVNHGDIRDILSQSKRVPPAKWHHQHIYPPCRFTGTIEHEGEQRRFAYYPTGYLSMEGIEDWFMCYDCTVHSDWVSFDGED